MATQVQFRRGTTAQNASFTGALGEVTVDTDKDTLVVHDGGTAGGFEISRADASNLKFPDGAVGTPAISFASDTNTGIYRGGTDILKFVTAGTDAITIDASGRVMVGTTTEGAANEAEELTIAGTGGVGMTIRSTDSGSSRIYFSDGTSGTSEYAGYQLYNHSSNAMIFGTNALQRMLIANNGDISFYEDTGTTPKLFWDSSEERLGIGTASPTHDLQVQSTSPTVTILSNVDNTSRFNLLETLGGSGDLGGFIQYEGVTNNVLELGTVLNGTDTTHIYLPRDGSGKVGIGVTPSTKLHVKNGTNQNFNVFGPSVFSNGVTIASTTDGFTGYLEMEQRATQFAWHNGSTEAMRIDSSQNLLVGTTSDNPSYLNVEGISLHSNGQIDASRQGSSLDLNRRTDDGDIAIFRKDGTTVGSIGVYTDRIYLSTANRGIALDEGSATLLPVNGTGINNDNTLNLGAGTVRWKNLYLSGGVVFGDAGGSGTSTSNTLDSYEEGTWTPTYVPSSGSFTSVTYASTNGEYTKIGNTVYFTFYIQTNAITVGSASGSVKIGGLPFTPSGGTTSNGGGTVTNSAFFAGDKPYYGTASGSSEINLFYSTGSTADDNFLDVSDLGTGSTANVFQMMGTYLTTS
jgi:hypothetical protein